MSDYKNLDKYLEKKGKQPKVKIEKAKEKDLDDAKIKELTIQMLKDFGYIEQGKVLK